MANKWLWTVEQAQGIMREERRGEERRGERRGEERRGEERRGKKSTKNTLTVADYP